MMKLKHASYCIRTHTPHTNILKVYNVYFQYNIYLYLQWHPNIQIQASYGCIQIWIYPYRRNINMECTQSTYTCAVPVHLHYMMWWFFAGFYKSVVEYKQDATSKHLCVIVIQATQSKKTLVYFFLYLFKHIWRRSTYMCSYFEAIW